MDHRQEYPERDELRAKFTAWLKVVIRNAKLNYLQNEVKSLQDDLNSIKSNLGLN